MNNLCYVCSRYGPEMVLYVPPGGYIPDRFEDQQWICLVCLRDRMTEPENQKNG